MAKDKDKRTASKDDLDPSFLAAIEATGSPMPEMIAWDDDRLADARRTGDFSRLPENVVIESPYGRGGGVVHVTSGALLGDDGVATATGDDGNTASTRAGATRGGARD
jgi:hypothetical protein